MDTIQVHAVVPELDESAEAYEEHLYGVEPVEIPCSARAVAYNGFTTGGLVAAMVKCWAMRQPFPRDVHIDHLSWGIVSGDYLWVEGLE